MESLSSSSYIRSKSLVADITLDNLSAMMSAMTSASALLFPGQLDRVRFDNAL